MIQSVENTLRNRQNIYDFKVMQSTNNRHQSEKAVHQLITFIDNGVDKRIDENHRNTRCEIEQNGYCI